MAGVAYGQPNAIGNQTLVVALPATGGGAMNASGSSVFSLTPTATETLTATVVPAGSEATIVVTTSGTTSYTITFGTGFKSTGTLATGTVSAKVFTIQFMSDGVNMNETGRTVAM